MALKRENDYSDETLGPKWFQDAMREYCEVFGESAYKPGALRYGYRELIGRDEAPAMSPERLKDILTILPESQERFLEMPALVKAIKLKQRPVVRISNPVNDEPEITAEDKEIIRKNMARFSKFREIATENGLQWWKDLFFAALKFCKVENLYGTLHERGWECVMNWSICIPYLKTLPIWAELEAAALVPTREIKASELRSNVRVFPKTQHLGNAAAYRAGN